MCGLFCELSLRMCYIVFVGDVSAEQQRTQSFLEFLSDNSDTEDADNVHSEPEAETIVMSCYHGIQCNDTVHQKGTERCGRTWVLLA